MDKDQSLFPPSTTSPLSGGPCLCLDLGRETAEAAAPLLGAALAELAAGQALLQKFRNPEQLKISYPGWMPLDAVKGPAAYRRVWVRQSQPTGGRFIKACLFHQHFHDGYRQSVKLVLAGEAEGVDLGLQLALELEAHMAWEEAQIYPQLSAFLGENRVARELGYEHQGLRSALMRWPGFLMTSLTGDSKRKQIESFELDLLHLFEHHVEREEQAIYPILDRLGSVDGNNAES